MSLPSVHDFKLADDDALLADAAWIPLAADPHAVDNTGRFVAEPLRVARP